MLEKKNLLIVILFTVTLVCRVTNHILNINYYFIHCHLSMSSKRSYLIKKDLI